MESWRSVHISYKVSGETLGIVWKKPEHDWTTFVSGLHYYAARKTGVPVWCVDLLWEYDPWDEAQLPMNVHLTCNISSVLPEISEITEPDGRCCCCWEDCEDFDNWNPMYGPKENWGALKYDLPYLKNCFICGTPVLCDLCRVQLRGGSASCLYCLVRPRGYSGLLCGGIIAETEANYQVRVADAFKSAGLTEAQQKRWRIVREGKIWDTSTRVLLAAAAAATALQD